MNGNICSGGVTTICDVNGSCCAGINSCAGDRVLCSSNITYDICNGLRCTGAHSNGNVCCPPTSQCCESYGSLACCIKSSLWWKWPALIASSVFLILTIILLYFTYRSSRRSSRRRERNVLHYDDMLAVSPPPYHLQYPHGLYKPHYMLHEEPPPIYTSRESTPLSLQLCTPPPGATEAMNHASTRERQVLSPVTIVQSDSEASSDNLSRRNSTVTIQSEVDHFSNINLQNNAKLKGGYHNTKQLADRHVSMETVGNEAT